MEIDEKATIKKVRHFLKVELPSAERRSHKKVVVNGSQVITGMPKRDRDVNHDSKIITDRVYAEQIVSACEDAIIYCDELSQQILVSMYIHGNTALSTQLESGYSESRFRHYHRQACLQFADAYTNRELHVYK